MNPSFSKLVARIAAAYAYVSLLFCGFILLVGVVAIPYFFLHARPESGIAIIYNWGIDRFGRIPFMIGYVIIYFALFSGLPLGISYLTRISRNRK